MATPSGTLLASSHVPTLLSALPTVASGTEIKQSPSSASESLSSSSSTAYGPEIPHIGSPPRRQAAHATPFVSADLDPLTFLGDVTWRPLLPLGHTAYSWGVSPPTASHIASDLNIGSSRHHEVPLAHVARKAVTEREKKAMLKSRRVEDALREKKTSETAGNGTNATKGKRKGPTTKGERKSAVAAGLVNKVQVTALQRLNIARLDRKQSPTEPILPVKDKRNILITSALPYVNNVPHLGNIIGSTLSADVYARFCRLRGHNCIYICGTDEYGTATETKALQEKTTPQAICDKYFLLHKRAYEWFNISFDYFGRTTTRHQTVIAQDIYKKIEASGHIVCKDQQQMYCAACKRFLADRFVFGECPQPGCGSSDARGDQCDKCTKPTSPEKLVNPRCFLCRTRPEQRVSAHLYLDLPKLTPPLSKWFAESEQKGKWSANAVATTNAWLHEGLEERCISRDLSWGTQIPRDGYTTKVFYVWFDAPIGYISITAAYCGAEKWQLWWKTPEDVELVQFFGKDNIPFHTVIFPASLIATREPYVLPHLVSATEYLRYCGGKFSKSKGVGVFADGAEQSGIPADVWRYYLLANRPEVSDTSFEWKDFAAKNNTELANTLGNFVQRTLCFVRDKLDSTVPTFVASAIETQRDTDVKFINACTEHTRLVIAQLETTHIKDALKTTIQVARLSNLYWQETKPWEEYANNNHTRCSTILAIGVNAVYLIGHLIQPFLPTVSEAIFEQVGKPMTPIFLQDEKFVFVPTLVLSGRKIGAPEPLFRNIDAEEVEALRTKFGGDATMEGEVFPLDLRVVTVIACISHPDPTAMNYWMLTVDCGEADQRLVSAGDLLISDRADITLNEASSAVDNVVDLRTKSPTEPRVPHEEVVPSVPHKEVVPSVPHKEVVPSAGETKEEKKIVLHTNAWLSRRTIVSELRSHYRAEELVGKRVIAAINTKPHQIKKVVSQGIILRASQTKMCGVLTSTQIPGTRVVPRGSPVELSPTFDPAKHWQRLNLVLRADSIAHFGSLPLEANGVSVSAERAPPGTHLDY